MSESFHVQGLSVEEIMAEHGSPLYVYDGRNLTSTYRRLRSALDPRIGIYYSLKANPNLAVTSLLGRQGAGAEISSLAELRIAQRAGIPASRTVFLGPGKSPEEIRAAIESDIRALVVESLDELELADRIAEELGAGPTVLLRVNPQFQVKQSGLTMGGRPRQFGIDEAALLGGAAVVRGLSRVRVAGIQVYMGTRILSAEAVVSNTERVLDLAERLAAACGFPLELVDIGGGLGVAYFPKENDLDLPALSEGVNAAVGTFAAAHPETELILESGRFLVAECGTYAATVRYVKESFGERFAVADGGLNHHMAAVGIGSVLKRNFPISLLNREGDAEPVPWNVTGPLCTPSDTIGKNVPLPADLRPGDVIGVHRAGAYGPTASPVLFLSHGHPAEVLAYGGRTHLVRRADTVDDLLAPHRLPEFDLYEPSPNR